jgi:hypothetical protein
MTKSGVNFDATIYRRPGRGRVGEPSALRITRENGAAKLIRAVKRAKSTEQEQDILRHALNAA